MSWRNSSCSVSGCNDRMMVLKFRLCQTHYHRMRVTGAVDLKADIRPCQKCGAAMRLIGSDRATKNYCSVKCQSAAKRKREAASPVHVARRINYKYAYKLRQYGLTPEEYDAIDRKQEGRCGICGTHKDNLLAGLGIDHDHKTGKVRGLLCKPCNAALGIFDDNPSILKSALEYLSAISDGDDQLTVTQ